MIKDKYIINSVIMIAVLLVTGAFLTSTTVSADDVVDEINITVPVSCTLSGTGVDSHNAEIANGTVNSTIGETTIKAFCNDNNGFAIYAIGYTDDTDGKNVLANSTLGSTYDIVTGTATSGDKSNWAMKLSAVTNPVPTYPIIIAGSIDDTDKEQGDPDYSTFQAVPDDYAMVAKRTTSTDIGASAEGASFKTTYQAYISPTQPASTYTGQVKYTLVHPNDGTAPEKPVACNPTGTTIGTNTNTDITCMQDISSTNKSSILTSMTTEQQYTLTDKRDNKAYAISKLADGNIWMTQNLDLDLDSTKTYTNEDTDLGWNGTSYSTASWTPSRSTYDSNTKTWCQGGTWDSQYNYCESNYTPESYNPGELYWNGTLSEYDDWNTYRTSCTWDSATHEPTCNESLNPIATYTTVSGTPTPQYHLGNFYNWSAAIASNDSSAYATEYQDINQSICPSGWTLPKSGDNTSNGSFRYLIEQYGWSDSTYQMTSPYIWNSTIKLPLTGQWWNGILGYIGYDNNLWSPMVMDRGYAYSVESNSYGRIRPAYDELTIYGNTVRCLTR